MQEIDYSARARLYLIAWLQPPKTGKQASWFKLAEKQLFEQGLIETREDKLVATQKGLDLLSPEALTALQRPRNYNELPRSTQWSIDKKLGILDWDGS